jgi:8-oxo-dGTP pyrophosphatase MutT (NUDIX family)
MTPEQRARKWWPTAYGGAVGPDGVTLIHEAIAAAIREALEEAEMLAREIGSRAVDDYYDDPNVPWQTVALNIAARIAALGAVKETG